MYRRNTTRLYKTENRTIQEYLEMPSKYSILVQFEARSTERIAFLPNTVTCSRSLRHTIAACIEKAVCMNTQDELYRKVRLTPRLPRVVLKSNSQCGLQDLQGQEARSSWTHQAIHRVTVKPGAASWIYRIPGTPLSTVGQQDTTRESKVKKLIEKV